MRSDGGRLARFANYKAEPEKAVGLREGHEATQTGRTLFPTKVTPTADAKRFLIDGVNNSKIGGRILKGEWIDMPVFTLTLEERATCPRSCGQWQTCYGNGMQWPNRWDHRDPDFLDTLRAEVMTLARLHPLKFDDAGVRIGGGVVVRLHVLGDFYSMAYLRMWIEMLDRFPQLHVYGYTARREDADDPESREIAAAIRRVSEAAYDQFAIRFSHSEPGPDRTIVVMEDPKLPDVIMCPAQPGNTATCGTCGLCWSPAARRKTIAFLKHGLKRGRRLPAEPALVQEDEDLPRGARRLWVNEIGLKKAASKLHAAMLRLANPDGILMEKPAKLLCDEADISVGNWQKQLSELRAAKVLQVLVPGAAKRAAVYRVFAEPQEAFPPVGNIPAPPRKANTRIPQGLRDPLVLKSAEPVRPLKVGGPIYSPKAKFHPRTGALLNPHVIGSAERLAIGTPQDRIATVSEEEKARIAATYGAVIRAKP